MRKAATRYLTLLVIGLVSLLVILVFVKRIYDANEVAGRVTGCALALKGVKDKPQFFGNDLGAPTYEFTRLLSRECIGFKDEGSIGGVFRAINYCWKEYGEGYDFLGEFDGSFCFVCGKFQVKNLREEYKANVKSLKGKVLFKDIDGVNLNSKTLSAEAIPDTDSVYVVYYARNSYNDSFDTRYDYFFSAISSLIGKTNEGRFMAGIFLVPADKGSFQSGVDRVKERFKSMGCDYVFVPDEVN